MAAITRAYAKTTLYRVGIELAVAQPPQEPAPLAHRPGDEVGEVQYVQNGRVKMLDDLGHRVYGDIKDLELREIPLPGSAEEKLAEAIEQRDRALQPLLFTAMDALAAGTKPSASQSRLVEASIDFAVDKTGIDRAIVAEVAYKLWGKPEPVPPATIKVDRNLLVEVLRKAIKDRISWAADRPDGDPDLGYVPRLKEIRDALQAGAGLEVE
jgi:hypothetical protein